MDGDGPLYELSRCTYLGGHGVEILKLGSFWDVVFWDDAIRCRQAPNTVRVGYEKVRTFEVGGPAATTTGGGFTGGGFGLAGAAEGMVAATVLNALTTRQRVQTVVRIKTPAVELFFASDKVAPDQARMALSRVFHLIEQARPPSETSSEPGDFVTRLERLVSLREAGHITSEELATLKLRLLSE